MKAVKLTGKLLLVIQIVSILAFGLSFHTITSILMTTLSGESLQLEMKFDNSGRGRMVVELLPSNQGFLDANVNLQVAIVDRFGEYITTNSTLVYLHAGSDEIMLLTLQFTMEDYERLVDDSNLEVTVDLRTLYNLVGVANRVSMEVQN